MCDIMYRRRLKGYALIGYKLFQNVSDNLFGTEQNVIYTGKNYQNTLLNDLSIAKSSVVVSTTKLWFHKYSTILNMFEKLLRRGVEVIVFLRQSPEGISQLSSIGAIVKIKEDLTIQSIIIDKHTTWYGSVNYLGHSTVDDNAIRLNNEEVADEMINMLYNK